MFPILILTLIFCAPAEGVDLLSAVPSDAQVLVYMPSVGESRDRLEASAWGRFFDEPQMQAVVDFIEQMQKNLLEVEQSEEGSEEEGDSLDFDLVKESISGSLALFARLQDLENGAAVLMVEPGEEREDFDLFCDQLKELLNESEDFIDSAESYNDLDILIWENTIEGEACVLLWADTGDVTVFIYQESLEDSMDQGLAVMQRTLDSLSGEGEGDTIRDNDAFMAVREKNGGPGDLEGYMNLNWLIQSAMDGMAEEEMEEDTWEQALLVDLGLTDVQCFYTTLAVGEGEELDASLYLGISGEGLIRQAVDFAGGDAPMGHLATIPANVFGMSSTYFDLPGLYNMFMEEFQARTEEDYNQFRALYDEFVVQRFKLDPEQEILAQLDGTFSTFTIEVPEEEVAMVQSAMGQPDDPSLGYGGIYLIGIKDRETFQKNFEKTLRAFGLYVSMKKEDFQGHRIYSIQTPMGGMRIYWAYGEDLFAIGAYPSAIRSYVRLLAHEDQPSIRNDEDFMSFLNSVPGASTISANKSSLVVAAMLDVVEMLLMPGFDMGLITVDIDGNEVEGEEVPPMPGKDIVDKHVKGLMGSFIVVTEDGILMTIRTR